MVDDNFVQPQPGTSAGDHVFSGFIPLALLALAVWAYPRVRPGARATLALVLVIPAILSGVEAIYYAGKGGLSGDDYTGLLAMAAAPDAARAGRHGRSGARAGWTIGLARRYGRRLLKTAGVLVLVALFALPLSVAYVGSHVTRADVPDANWAPPTRT